MTGYRAIDVISTKFFLDEFLHPDEGCFLWDNDLPEKWKLEMFKER